MAVDTNLKHLVDIALGVPDKGVINFNVLRELLLEILSKFDDKAVVQNSRQSPDNQQQTVTIVKQHEHFNSPRETTQDVQSAQWLNHDSRLDSLEKKLDILTNLPSIKNQPSTIQQPGNHYPSTNDLTINQPSGNQPTTIQHHGNLSSSLSNQENTVQPSNGHTTTIQQHDDIPSGNQLGNQASTIQPSDDHETTIQHDGNIPSGNPDLANMSSTNELSTNPPVASQLNKAPYTIGQDGTITGQHGDQTMVGDNEGLKEEYTLMWKYITLHRRVQATEEAVETVMNLLNTLETNMAHVTSLRSDMTRLRTELTATAPKISSDNREMDKSEEFRKMSSFLAKFDGENDSLVLQSDLINYVTWTALQDALNKKGYQGISEDQHGTSGIVEDNITTDDSQVDQTSVKEDVCENVTDEEQSRILSKENSFDENPELISKENSEDSIKPPSQLIKQLNRIGELPKQYDDVAVQVSCISEMQSKLSNNVQNVEEVLLPQKVDKKELNLPENLMEQIEMLKEGLDYLNANQDIKMISIIKDTTLENKQNMDSLRNELALFGQHLKRIEQSRNKTPEITDSSGYDQAILNNLRENLTSIKREQDKMAEKNNEDIARLLENLDDKQRIIDGLIEYTQRLHEGKADRENVETEMNVKADKHALDSKVSQSTFEETFEMFDKGLQEALQKMEEYLNEELSLKDTLARISQDMEGKIDNDSLNLMKEYFEKQIRDVQESRNQIARETRVDPTNAAGVRRKLPIHYHCISCDRPVELAVKDSEPVLPGSESLPLRKLKFPLTSYDVEQLRQKSGKGGFDEAPTLRELLSGRPCGGSHTVINSQIKRATKLHHFTNIVGREESKISKVANEVSVLDFLRGSDGNYYKGRTKHVLPSLPKRPHRTVLPKHLSPESLSEQKKVTTYTTYKQTPSPPSASDDMSTSYPEKALQSRKNLRNVTTTQQYSCDDLNVPSIINNKESLKILQTQRRRNDIKGNRLQQCWGTQDSDIRVPLPEGETNCENKLSPKSSKRTTPIGQEQSVVEEGTTRNEQGQTQDSSSTSEDT